MWYIHIGLIISSLYLIYRGGQLLIPSQWEKIAKEMKESTLDLDYLVETLKTKKMTQGGMGELIGYLFLLVAMALVIIFIWPIAIFVIIFMYRIKNKSNL